LITPKTPTKHNPAQPGPKILSTSLIPTNQRRKNSQRTYREAFLDESEPTAAGGYKKRHGKNTRKLEE